MLFRVWAKYLPSVFALNTDPAVDGPGHLPDWSSFPPQNTSSVSETMPPRPQIFTFRVCQVAGAALQAYAPEYPGNGTNPRYSATAASIPYLRLFRAGRPRSFPAFQTDESGKRLSPRCRGLPSSLRKHGRIAGQGLRKLLFGNDGVDEFADHGVLAGTDQIQVLALRSYTSWRPFQQSS